MLNLFKVSNRDTRATSMFLNVFKSMKSFRCFSWLWTDYTPCSRVFIVDFEQVKYIRYILIFAFMYILVVRDRSMNPVIWRSWIHLCTVISLLQKQSAGSNPKKMFTYRGGDSIWINWRNILGNLILLNLQHWQPQFTQLQSQPSYI